MTKYQRRIRDSSCPKKQKDDQLTARRKSGVTYSNNFGTGVMRTTAAGFKELATSFESSHAEVRDFDVLFTVKQQIFGFEISVTNVEPMAVIDSRYDLLKVVQRFIGMQSTTLNEVVKQLASLDIFHDKVSARASHQHLHEIERVQLGLSLQVIARLPHVHEPQHIRMLNQFHDHDLALDTEQHLYDEDVRPRAKRHTESKSSLCRLWLWD